MLLRVLAVMAVTQVSGRSSRLAVGRPDCWYLDIPIWLKMGSATSRHVTEGFASSASSVASVASIAGGESRREWRTIILAPLGSRSIQRNLGPELQTQPMSRSGHRQRAGGAVSNAPDSLGAIHL
jgi:hypothetical protein